MGMSWPYLGAFMVGAVFASALGVVQAVLYLMITATAWYLSVRWHPTRPCWTCEGGGRHKGFIASYASRPCGTCGGSGRRPRFGTRIFRVET